MALHRPRSHGADTSCRGTAGSTSAAQTDHKRDGRKGSGGLLTAVAGCGDAFPASPDGPDRSGACRAKTGPGASS